MDRGAWWVTVHRIANQLGHGWATKQAVFSVETLQDRREWNDILKILKDKNCEPRIPYPAKLLFRYEGEIKVFPNKSLMRFMTTRQVAPNEGWILGLGRSPGAGNGNPSQYSCLENSMDRVAWWATVHGVTKSQTMIQHTHRHRTALQKVLKDLPSEMKRHKTLSKVIEFLILRESENCKFCTRRRC